MQCFENIKLMLRLVERIEGEPMRGILERHDALAAMKLLREMIFLRD